MSFDDMPNMPQMYLPGAQEYAKRVLSASKRVAAHYRTVMDVPYGNDYWQKVDFYLPDDDQTHDLPVFCMIHGGAFRNGFKEWMGFMAPPLLDLPAVYVSFNYRLVPQVKVGDIIGDCFDALNLVYARVEEYGGSPNRIFVGGHSAGGHLAAQLALRPDLSVKRGMPSDVVKGACPVSGIYDLRREQAKPGSVLERTYEGMFDSPEEAADCSPIVHVSGNTTPFFVAWGTCDSSEIIDSSKALVAGLKNEPCVAEQHVWEGLGHFEANEIQADPNDAWVGKVRQWLTS